MARGGQGNASTISLKSMYDSASGSQIKIKVEIQGVKHLPAVYLACMVIPIFVAHRESLSVSQRYTYPTGF